MRRKGNIKFSLLLLLVASSLVNGWSQDQVSLTLIRRPADIISFQGNVGVPYLIEQSTNLVDWNQLVILNGTPSGYHRYTNFPTQPHLFYKASTPVWSEIIKVELSNQSPDAGFVIVDEGNRTDSVLIASYIIRSTNISTLLRSLTLSVTAIGTNASEVVDTLYLVVNGEEIGSESVPTSQLVTFDNLDVAIAANGSVTFNVVADLKAGNHYTNATKVFVTINASGTTGGLSNNPVATDAGAVIVGVTPSVSESNPQLLLSYAAGVTFVSSFAETVVLDGGASTALLCTIEFRVTAIGNPIYLSMTNSVIATGEFDSLPTTLFSQVIERVAGATIVGNYVKVNDGQTVRMRFQGIVGKPAGTFGIGKARIIGLRFVLMPSSLTEHVVDYGLDELQTPYVFF